MSVKLPEVSLRDAVANQDWESAMAILAEHTLNVRRAIDDPPPDMDSGAWKDLMARQEAFRSELAVSRMNVRHLLERLARHTRGAAAYRKGGL